MDLLKYVPVTEEQDSHDAEGEMIFMNPLWVAMVMGDDSLWNTMIDSHIFQMLLSLFSQTALQL